MPVSAATDRETDAGSSGCAVAAMADERGAKGKVGAAFGTELGLSAAGEVVFVEAAGAGAAAAGGVGAAAAAGAVAFFLAGEGETAAGAVGAGAAIADGAAAGFAAGAASGSGTGGLGAVTAMGARSVGETMPVVGIRGTGSWSAATIRGGAMGERRADESSGFAAAMREGGDETVATEASGRASVGCAAAGSDGAAGALRQETRRKAAKAGAAAARFVFARII
jgi:hypothetical protein